LTAQKKMEKVRQKKSKSKKQDSMARFWCVKCGAFKEGHKKMAPRLRSNKGDKVSPKIKAKKQKELQLWRRTLGKVKTFQAALRDIQPGDAFCHEHFVYDSATFHNLSTWKPKDAGLDGKQAVSPAVRPTRATALNRQDRALSRTPEQLLEEVVSGAAAAGQDLHARIEHLERQVCLLRDENDKLKLEVKELRRKASQFGVEDYPDEDEDLGDYDSDDIDEQEDESPGDVSASDRHQDDDQHDHHASGSAALYFAESAFQEAPGLLETLSSDLSTTSAHKYLESSHKKDTATAAQLVEIKVFHEDPRKPHQSRKLNKKRPDDAPLNVASVCSSQFALKCWTGFSSLTLFVSILRSVRSWIVARGGIAAVAELEKRRRAACTCSGGSCTAHERGAAYFTLSSRDDYVDRRDTWLRDFFGFLAVLRCDLSLNAVSCLLALSQTHMQRVFRALTLATYFVLKSWCIVSLSIDRMENCTPNSFKDERSCALVDLVIDGTYLRVPASRHFGMQGEFFCGHKHYHLCKIMDITYSNGRTAFVSRLYSAKTDEYIFEKEGLPKMLNDFGKTFFDKRGRRLRIGFDRGFREPCTGTLNADHVEVVRPYYLQPNDPQFSADEVRKNAEISAVRSVVERKHARQKQYAMLSNKIDYAFIPLLHQLFYIASALDDICNLPCQLESTLQVVAASTPSTVFDADRELTEHLLLEYNIRDPAKRPGPPAHLVDVTGTPLEEVKSQPKKKIDAELSAYTAIELRNICERLKLSKTGTKAVLAQRIREHYQRTQVAPLDDNTRIPLLALVPSDNGVSNDEGEGNDQTDDEGEGSEDDAPPGIAEDAPDATEPSTKKRRRNSTGSNSAARADKRPRTEEGVEIADTERPPASATQLPHPWVSKTDLDDRLIYENSVTGEQTWRPPPFFAPLGGGDEWMKPTWDAVRSLLPDLTEQADGTGFDIEQVGARRNASTYRNVLPRARLYLQPPKPRATLRTLKIHASSTNGAYNSEAEGGVAGSSYLQLRVKSSFAAGVVRTVRAGFSGGWLRLVCSCPNGKSGRCAHCVAMLLLVRQFQQSGTVSVEPASASNVLVNIHL
jgi:hypothetical protein